MRTSFSFRRRRYFWEPDQDILFPYELPVIFYLLKLSDTKAHDFKDAGICILLPSYPHQGSSACWMVHTPLRWRAPRVQQAWKAPASC